VKFNDGTSEEFKFSTIRLGMRLRAFYKSKAEDVAGQKQKINVITRLQLLGHDDFTRLRHILKLDPSLPVSVVESLNLPAKSPLKLHFALEPQGLDIALIQWVHRWNAEESAKYGRIEIVDDLEQADASVVVIWGRDDSYFNPALPLNYERDSPQIGFATVYLISKDANGLRVGWQDLTVADSKPSPTMVVAFGKGLEKKLKARSK
jgi:hypothetical protein